MRTIFDKNLDELHRDLLELGVFVNRAIEKATQAFIDHDLKLVKEIIAEDQRINEKEREIDQKSQQLIAVQQPTASDLRRIISIMRASSNLERMGDHAQNIAEATGNLKGHKRSDESERLIQDMSTKVLEMSNGIIDAFIDFDVDRAVEIAHQDIEVDQLYNQLRNTAIRSMREDSKTVHAGSDYSFIGMDLERIGDYVTNISEGIVYLDKGEVVDLNRRKK